jgi:fucose 4-O-acetylase-like acetyltransferase
MDQVRGLAIVLVVAYHTKTVLGRFTPDVPDALGLAQELFEPFRMPLLVFLSGMLLNRSLARPAGAFVSGKLRRIAWPYLVWSVLFFTVAAKASPERLLLLAVDPPNHLWYLYNLVLYYLLVLAAQWLRAPLRLVAPAALLASTAVDAYGPRRFLFLLAFFVAGHLVSMHGDRLGHRGLWLTVCTGVSAAGALANAAGIALKYEPAFAVVPAAGIALCLLLAPSHTEGPVAWLFGQVGRSSLVFYVAHYPVLWVVFTGLREVVVQAPLPMYAIGFVVALAAGAALVRLRSRWRLVDALFEFPPRAPDRVRLAVRALHARTAASDKG